MQTTVDYRVLADSLTPKIWCQNDDAVNNEGHQKLTNIPEEIRLLTNRHLVSHFRAMNNAPIQ